MDDKQFRDKLNPEQYRVMRQKGTETPFTGRYWDHDEAGSYACAACGSKLFSSRDKFDAGTGWPSFKKPIDPEKVSVRDGSEVACAECGSHLGDLAGSGPEKYYQLNSIGLDFEESKVPGLLEDAKDKAEEVNDKIEEEKEKKASLKPTVANVIILVVAVAAGVALGAGGYGALVCQAPAAGQLLGGIPAPAVSSTLPGPTSTKPSGASGATPAGGTSTASSGASANPKPTSTPGGAATGTAAGTAAGTGDASSSVDGTGAVPGGSAP